MSIGELVGFVFSYTLGREKLRDQRQPECPGDDDDFMLIDPNAA